MSSQQKRLILPATLAVIAVTVGIYLTHESEEAVKRPTPRSFESYRAEFRKADGSLPSDAELLNQLVTKGIPFTGDAQCEAKAGGCAPTPPAQRSGAQISFGPSQFSAAEQNAVKEKFSAIMANHGKTVFAAYPGLHLESAEVTAGSKLRLHFNRDFLFLAADEGALTEFSEGFAELANSGIKGTEIFVEGRRLGEHLRQLDAERDKAALKAQPPSRSTR